MFFGTMHSHGQFSNHLLGTSVVRESDFNMWLESSVEHEENQLQGWSPRILSRDGQLVLIKSVLSSLPVYYMSISECLKG